MFQQPSKTFLPFFTWTAGLLLALTLIMACQPKPKPTAISSMDLNTNPYEADWKRVDSLEQAGLPKSALEAVIKIKEQALRDHQSDHWLKALIFQGKFTLDVEEDGTEKAILLLESEGQTAAQPAKSILQSLLGEWYQQYLIENQWKIASRTPIRSEEVGDIKTWSTTKIAQKSAEYYQISIQEADLLEGIPLPNWQLLLQKGSLDTVANSALRSNLYDLLVFRVLDYYQDSRSFLSEPAYRFDLNQESAFNSAAQFAAATFETRDSQSTVWNAIQLYQALTKRRLNEANPARILDLELNRLQFAVQQSNLPNREVLYRSALENRIKEFEATENVTEAIYALANQLVSDAQSSQNPAQQLETAVQWCDKAIRMYPNAFGTAYCLQLRNQIQELSLKVNIELNNIPNEPILLSVAYKNTQNIGYKIVRLPEPSAEEQYDDAVTYFLGMPEVVRSAETLAAPGDYLSHRTEIRLEGLPAGRYALLAGHQKNIQTKSEVTDYAVFNSCGIAAVRLYGDGQNTAFLALDRKTGAPLIGVKGTLMESVWANDRYVRRQKGEYLSDNDGKIILNKELPHNSFLVLKKDQDVFVTDPIFQYGTHRERPRGSVAFFTDRGLYRPGQSLYFKGIALEKTPGNQPAILKNQAVQVQLLDANYQQVAELKLKTNAFGTFNGAFSLPVGQLTGSFTLRAKAGIAEGQAQVQVEEYKRPKFEVTVNPTAGDYRIGSKVTVSGKAMNYAGNPTDGADVVYRVVRKSHYPWWWGRWMPTPNTDQQEIISGTAKTNGLGVFQFDFVAQPSSQPVDQQPPAFHYEVSIDVTDNTGETRSATTTVAVGKNGLFLGSDLPEEMEVSALKSVNLIAENLAGQALTTKGTVTIQRLNAPNRLFRNRLFEQPDRWSMTEQNFRAAFPTYAWKNEAEPTAWPTQGNATTLGFDTGISLSLDLSASIAEAGYYNIQLKAKDPFGTEIITKQIVHVKKTSTDFVRPTVEPEQTTLEPGQTAKLNFGALVPSWKVYVQTERPNQPLEQRWKSVTNSDKIDLPVTEKDRGNFYTAWICMYDNRVYQGKITWEIPWSNKRLQLSLESFRDKLQPGAKETWTLRVGGPDKEKVAAEITAAMYDASLDQFMPFHWSFFPHANYTAKQFIQEEAGSRTEGHQFIYVESDRPALPNRYYTRFDWFGLLDKMTRSRYLRAKMAGAPMSREMIQTDAMETTPTMASEAILNDNADSASNELVQKKAGMPQSEVPAQVRRNLQETVFFYPELKTDANGDVLIQFTMNEALTRWKLQLLAHTQDLKVGLLEKSLVTQKELMISANPPRFLRAGDQIEFSAKVSNLTDQVADGTATLALLDANTLQPVEKQFGLLEAVQPFRLAAGQSSGVRWKISIPVDYVGAITWQVFALGKDGRDGEENTLPVITNRMLVTESLPMTLRSQQNKTFQFQTLKQSDSRTNHRFTLEFTSNPAWYAVQALPYLMEYPHECSEQLFNRYYANTLASAVTRKLPAISRVFDRWKGTEALESNLSKNQELKYALLEETPWVLESQSEAQQKQQIGLLFDLNNMANGQAKSIRELQERQSDNGGWPWFAGGPESWYITQYIASGMAHLVKLKAHELDNAHAAKEILDKAIKYCDAQARLNYQQIERDVKAGRTKWEDDHLHSMVVQYLYLKSFYPVNKPDPIVSYYQKLIGKYWTSKNLYEQGMLALIASRAGETTTANGIIRSLKERAVVKEEMGMYWPNNWGMQWNQLPIETQALLIEVFNEVANDATAVEDLRIWMLKNKQTNRWESTKATAEAVYALLLTGDNWLNNTQPVKVMIENKPVQPNEYEAGTGYFKETWTGKEYSDNWQKIAVQNPNKHLVWGAAYRQYFEDLDQITTFKTNGIQLVRGVYKKVNTDRGPVLEAVTDGGKVSIGDQLIIRVEIRADRDMEYVHLKDLRPAGCEPRNVLSGYQYQGGLGYYESTKDLATHYFMDQLPKGTYVLEYPITATHKGEMSFGLATLQCMYAPEFASHSSGIRIKIE